MDVELPFSYIDADLVINGQVDLIIKNKDDELEIIDYKSRYKEGLQRMNVDIQLRIYNMALQSKYGGEIKKICAYTFKDNTQTRFTNSIEDLEKTKSWSPLSQILLKTSSLEGTGRELFVKQKLANVNFIIFVIN